MFGGLFINVAPAAIMNSMEQTFDLVQVVQNVVLYPSVISILTLIVTSLVNEMFVIFPYVVVLSGQVLFLENPLSIPMLARLLVFIALPVGIGPALGSLPAYGLAYFGGKPVIEKFGRHFQVSWGDVEKMELRFKGSWYDEILFLALRCIPLLPYLPISVAAGILRMRLAPFFVLTVTGAIIRMMIMFALVGFGVEAMAD